MEKKISKLLIIMKNFQSKKKLRKKSIIKNKKEIIYLMH